MVQARWVSESEARWAAHLFAAKGLVFIGSKYGKPKRRVMLSGVSHFQADRLKERFGGSIVSDRWHCSGGQASFFLRTIKCYVPIPVRRIEDVVPLDVPRCGHETRAGTACQRVARTDLGYTTCWTHRAPE